VTFSGVDCSGKSTQIGMLHGFFEHKGEHVRVFWYRPGYSRELDAFRSIVRSLSSRAMPRASEGPKREDAFRRPWVRRAWFTAAILDMLFQYGVKLRIILASGKTVICDRYVADSFIDLSLRFPELVMRNGRLERTVTLMAPQPDHSLLLMVPSDELTRRLEGKNEPFPDSTETREARWKAYDSFAESGAAKQIDAIGTAEEVHARVLRAVGLVRSGEAP
jgi:thymidylate kinase